MPDLEPRDYNEELGETDFSQAKDFSSGENPENYTQNFSRNPGEAHEAFLTGGNNNNALVKNGNLQKAWNGGISGGKGDSRKIGNNADGISRKSGLYSGGISRKAAGKSKVKGKLSAQFKKRAAIWVFGLLFSGGGSIAILFSGQHVLAAKILDVIKQRFNAPTSKSVSDHTKKLWKCKLSSSCSKEVKDEEGSSGEEGDDMGQISKEAEESIEANKGKVNAPANGEDGNIELPSGEKITPTEMDNMTPQEESDFTNASPATNETYGANAGEPTADMLKETGANKNIPLAEDVGDDDDGKPKTIDEQLEDQKKSEETGKAQSEASDLTVQNAETVSPDETPDFAKTSSSGSDDNEEKPGFEEPAGGTEPVEPAASVESDAKEDMEKAGNAADDPNKGAATLLVSIACGISGGTNGAIKAYNLGVKLYKLVHLVRFGMELVTVMNAVEADDGSGQKGHNGPSAEQFSQVMNSLTTVLKDKNGNITTKSATDSFGYQAAAGYLSTSGGDGKFNLSNTKDLDSAGNPTKFTASVSTTGALGSSGGNGDILTRALSQAGSSSTVNKLIGLGCDGLTDLLTFGQGAELIAGAANIEDPVSWGLDLAQLAATAGGALGSLTKSQWLSIGSSVLGSAGACGQAIAGAGAITAWAGCAFAALSTAAVIFLPGIINNLINSFTKGFLKDPLPVGSDAMDALISGMGASQGMNAAGNGVPVLGSTRTTSGLTKYLAVSHELTAYNQRQDAVARVTASPFDIENQATALGSIAGNFFANLYANGNTPVQMLGALFGMFGTNFANLANGSSASADAASTAYASSCTDGDIASAQLAADPFCNPIYGLSDSDTIGVQAAVEGVKSFTYTVCDDKSSPSLTTGKCTDGTYPTSHPALDKADCQNWDGTYGMCDDATFTKADGTSTKVSAFLSECVTRNTGGSSPKFTPMGTSSTETNIPNGQNCVISSSSTYGESNLVIFYNYIDYYLANNNINQGSNLGCQADGSCENGGSSSSDSSSTSSPNGGVSFTDSDSVDTNKQTTWDTDGSATNLYGDQNHQDETSFTNGGQPLNADEINYIALNPGWASANGLKLGDVAALTYNGKTIFAVYGDNHAGDTPHAEISARASMNLSGQSTPTNLTGVKFNIYPNTASKLGTSFTQDDINRVGKAASGS